MLPVVPPGHWGQTVAASLDLLCPPTRPTDRLILDVGLPSATLLRWLPLLPSQALLASAAGDARILTHSQCWCWGEWAQEGAHRPACELRWQLL